MNPAMLALSGANSGLLPLAFMNSPESMYRAASMSRHGLSYEDRKTLERNTDKVITEARRQSSIQSRRSGHIVERIRQREEIAARNRYAQREADFYVRMLNAQVEATSQTFESMAKVVEPEPTKQVVPLHAWLVLLLIAGFVLTLIVKAA